MEGDIGAKMTIKTVAWAVGGAVLLGAGGAAGYASLQPAKTQQGLVLGELDLGGLTKGELEERLQSWWDSEKTKQISPRSSKLNAQPAPMTVEQLGIRPDFAATLSKARYESQWSKWLGESQGGELEIEWTLVNADSSELATFVKAESPDTRPAAVRYVAGRVTRIEEVTQIELDSSRLGDSALEAIKSGQSEFEIPLVSPPPKILPHQLSAIKEVVAEFTTRFKTSQENRSGNIRLSAEKLNGVILMPGDELSYNKVVGPRQAETGFRMAPVYKNGRTELGIGGGICQTVTTLFNAALLADLKIVKRQNHSMPVSYVPLGRDATTSYGVIDLVVKNTFDHPIAISSEVGAGTLTFRVLGTKVPGKTIELLVTDYKYWGHGVKYVDDPSLPAGTTKTVDKGSAGRSCVTWRIVKQDGVEVRRERIGSSYYTAFPSLVARGAAPSTEPSPAEGAGGESSGEPPAPPPG